jgi:hypothetical protein
MPSASSFAGLLTSSILHKGGSKQASKQSNAFVDAAPL